MATRGVRFRFNLRTLLLATTVVCIVMGWALVDAIRQNRLESDARLVVRKLGGTIAEQGWSLAAQDRPGWLARTLGLQRAMRSLWLVNLAGTRPTADDLMVLAECGWIRQLDLSNTPVGDAELAVVAQFPRLIDLRLVNTAVTDEGIQVLHGQDALAVLDVQGTRVSYDGLRQLDRLLGSTNFEHAAAVQHGPFPGVSLPAFPDRVQSAEQADFGLHLQKTGDVGHLSITNGVAFDPACWQHLNHLNLSVLSASFGRTPLRGFQNVGEWNSLESISVDGGQLTDADLAALAKLPKLKVVEIVGSNELTDDAPLQLGVNNSIQELELSGSRISLGIISRLTNLRAFETLTLNVWQKGADGKYGFLRRDDAQAAALAISQLAILPRLRRVQITGNVFNDDAITALGMSPRLTEITYDPRFVTIEAVAKLQVRLPTCKLGTWPNGN